VNVYLDFLALFGIGGAHPGGLNLTRELLQKEKITTNTRLLDVGCGTGQTAEYIMSKYGCHVTGIDNHPIMINKANKRKVLSGLPITYQIGNIEKLNLHNKYDLIIAESVLSFTDIKLSVSELYRLLEPGGILLAIEMTDVGLKEDEKNYIKDFYGVHEISQETEWIELFERSGFNNVVSTFNYRSLKQTTSNVDDNTGTEFQLSPNIPEEFFKVLEQHEQINSLYKNKLGFRVYRCVK